MAYATEKDLIDAAGGAERFEELVSRPAPAGVVDARQYWLDQALVNGDAALDAYLAPRYATPLAQPSQIVIQSAADEAVYWLARTSGVATDDEKDAHMQRLELFRDLRDGKVWPGDPAPTPTTGRKSVYVRNRNTVNSRSLKGYI